MKVEWNKVTWYSKFGAVLLFLIVLPALAFYIGTQYEQVVSITSSVSNAVPAEDSSLKQKLIKLSVDFNLLSIWNIRPGTFVHPQMPNRFYYASADSTGLRIGYYDFAADTAADATNLNSFNISQHTNWVYTKNMFQTGPSDRELRIVGFDGNKLVFYETSSDDTPGPCASPWLRTGAIQYLYVDIANDSSEARPYVMPNKQRQAYQAEEDKCIKDNS